MEHKISSTDLARSLGDVLGRVRYRGDSFVIERNGTPVARLTPVVGESTVGVREALRAWCEAAEPDAGLADLLEWVGAADQLPSDPWAS